MRLEQTVFRYLADEVVCSRWELTEYARLWGAGPTEAVELLGVWRAQGWLEEIPLGESHGPPLLQLTELAYEAHPWLTQAS